MKNRYSGRETMYNQCLNSISTDMIDKPNKFTYTVITPISDAIEPKMCLYIGIV